MGLTIHYHLHSDTRSPPRRGGSLRICVSEPLTCPLPRSGKSWS